MASTKETFVPELSLFEKASTLLAVQDNFIDAIPTKSTLTGPLTVLQFSVPASPTLYTDLANSFLLLNVKITRGDGSNLQAGDSVGPINNVLGSLIKSCDFYINDTRVSSSYDCYTYISFMENFLASSEEKASNKKLGYAEDSLTRAGAMDSTVTGATATNEGLKTRAAWFTGSREVQFIGRIHTPAHTSTKYYLPFLSFDYSFTLNKPEFCLQYDVANNFKFVITKASMLMRKIKISPSVQLAHSQLLNNQDAIYDVRRYAFSTFTQLQGQTNFSKTNLFISDTMPKQIIVLISRETAVNGASNRNPLYFDHHNLKTINLRVGENNIPANRLDLNIGGGDIFKQLYQMTLDGMGVGNGNPPANFTPDIFKESMMMLWWDVTRNQDPTSEYHNSYYDKSSIILEGTFDDAPTENLIFLCFSVYLNRIMINSSYMATPDW